MHHPPADCPTALRPGDEGHCHHGSHCHPWVAAQPLSEQPLGPIMVAPRSPLPAVVTVAGLDCAMGQMWLCLLILAALFGPAAPRVTARIWVQPPAPTMYRQLMLTCEVTGDPGPQEFLWEKQGSPVPLQKGPDSVLFFPSFNDTHLDTYICTASGPQGWAVATYTLRMNDLGTSVFVFPQESPSAHVQVTARLEQPLSNFTVCLRSYTDLTRPYSLFSYATKTQSNEILLFKSEPGQYEFLVGGRSLIFRVPQSLEESEHVCASWESATGIVGFWFNGKPWPRKGLQKGYTVGVPAYIVLGQDQDSFGGGFDTKQSFVGEISSVYMWDMGISTSGVRAAMYDSPDQSPIFGWRNFPYKIVGEVYLKP